jgi:fermentation-respiration switch protein FrsA (DUF1100 family)
MQLSIKKLFSIFKQIIIAVIVAVLIWSVIAMIFEERFIFFPDKYPSGRYKESPRVPNLVDCWITAEDGVKLHGWYVSNDSAIATLVIAHGNAGNISHRLDILQALQHTGFNVLMFDYRGYGRSDGSPSEDGTYKDGRAAFDYVQGLPNIDPYRIIIWGTSLGGAVAVDIATQRQAAGLILESTFTSAKDLAAIHYPFLPARYFIRTKLNSIDKIANIHIPLLVIHGTKDELVPMHLGKKLFAAANEPKEFYEIFNADHNNTFFIDKANYLNRVREFVVRCTSPKSR